MAVVTSSVPLGGEVVGWGGGSAVRARRVGSASEGEPARTGRGPWAASGLTARGAAFGFGLVRDLAAAFGFGFAFVAVAFGFAFVAVAVPPPEAFARSRPNRVGRVAGRLPRMLSSSV